MGGSGPPLAPLPLLLDYSVSWYLLHVLHTVLGNPREPSEQILWAAGTSGCHQPQTARMSRGIWSHSFMGCRGNRLSFHLSSVVFAYSR